MIGLLPPPLLRLSRQQVVSLSKSSCASPVELSDERGVGEGVKSSDGGEKSWSSVNHSIFSVFDNPTLYKKSIMIHGNMISICTYSCTLHTKVNSYVKVLYSIHE
jgi:hypothetical protein